MDNFWDHGTPPKSNFLENFIKFLIQIYPLKMDSEEKATPFRPNSIFIYLLDIKVVLVQYVENVNIEKKWQKRDSFEKSPYAYLTHILHLVAFFRIIFSEFFHVLQSVTTRGQDWYTGICLWLPLASYLFETFFKCVLSVRNGFWKYNHFNEIRFHKFHRRNNMRTNNDQELSFSEANTRRCSYERL